VAARPVNQLYLIAMRLLIVGVGCWAVAWGATAFPIVWRQSSIERIADHIVDGDPFKMEGLTEVIPGIEVAEQAEYCRPTTLRAGAVIRLRMAENIVAAGERELIDISMRSLSDSIRRSLRCAPADPFLWLGLFWVENARTGFSPRHLEYLRMSYRLGANEGWVGLKRNGMALAVFEQLPPDLAEMAIGEFAKLLDTGFYGEAVSIFTGPGWRVRDLLLPRLKKVAEVHRQAFAKALYTRGYDVAVPGVTHPESRPWH
jgi:hypothetical protein